MAFFMALSTVQPAYADDVQRNENGSVTYQNNTYQPIRDASGNAAIAIPPGLPAGTDGYFRYDSAARKAHFLLTSGGASQATTAQYVVYDFMPPDVFTGSSPPVSVNFTSSSTPSTDTAAEEDQAPTSGSTCANSTLSGIGWIVCPVVNILASSMDFIYGIIADFLEVKTVTADTNGPVYRLWSIVRDISNICFVIVFLFIVYSQVTSLGISNYGLKKMLPKLIIAAILMNTSYWISAFAVDASNLLGYSIHSLFRSVFETLSVGANYSGEIPLWQDVAAVALASTGAVVGGITILSGTISGSILLLIPILVSVALAALVALLVLAARQALLMCLIIISPLAFVGYVLPNTEKYFDKWRSTFLTLLMLFPIFSVIFSGAQLAGMAIVQTSGGNLVTIILGMGVQVAPIVITPLLIKFSSGLIGKIAGMVNNPNKGIVDRTRKWAKGAQQERKNKILSDQNKFKGLNNSWLNPAGKATRGIDTFNRRRDARRKAYEAGAENRFDATKSGQRTQALNRDMQSQKQEVANRFERSSYGQRSNFRSQMANIDKDRATTEFDRSSYGQQVSHSRGIVDADKIRAAAEFDASNRGKDVDTRKREAERFKQTVHADHEQHWNVRNMTNAEGSQEREMRLRIANDKSASSKADVDAVYSEVKSLDTRSLSSTINQAVAADLAKNAYLTAEKTTLTAARNSQAANQLKVEINNSLMTNGGARDIKDVSGNIIANLDDRTINGLKLQEYATGIGSTETMLATAIAEKRSDWAKQASAAGQLIEHFNLSAVDAQKLADRGKGAVVVATDSSGNTFTFDAGDEYIKEAAIVKQFKEGSASNKKAMLEESAAKVAVKDANGNIVRDASGNITYRVGYNYEHRTTVADEAQKAAIQRLLPYVSDVSYDIIKQGKWDNDSEYVHSIRQIAEGRIKVDNLSGAADTALKTLKGLKAMKANDPTKFDYYKTQLFDLYQQMFADNPAEYQRRVNEFDSNFDNNFGGMLASFKRIIENTNLSRDTSLVSRDVIRDTLNENNISFHEQ